MRIWTLGEFVLVRERVGENIGSEIIMQEFNPWWRGEVVAVGGDVCDLSVGEIVRFQPGNHPNVFDYERVRYIRIEQELVYLVQDKEGKTIRVRNDMVLLWPQEKKWSQFGRSRILGVDEYGKDLAQSKVIGIGADVVEVQPGAFVLHRSSEHWRYFRYRGEWMFCTKMSNIEAVVA